MKTQEIILWTLLLIIIDQVIKIIINSYFLESHFDIIPSLIELKPTFNDKHSYFNSLLNRYSNLNIGLEIHLSLFLIAEIVILTLYSFFRSFSDNIKLLDIAIIFQMAGMICALIGNLIWENGTLDYIYLKPLFIFDLKDLYINCFALIFLLYVHKNKNQIKTKKIKDIVLYLESNLRK